MLHRRLFHVSLELIVTTLEYQLMSVCLFFLHLGTFNYEYPMLFLFYFINRHWAFTDKVVLYVYQSYFLALQVENVFLVMSHYNGWINENTLKSLLDSGSLPSAWGTRQRPDCTRQSLCRVRHSAKKTRQKIDRQSPLCRVSFIGHSAKALPSAR